MRAATGYLPLGYQGYREVGHMHFYKPDVNPSLKPMLVRKQCVADISSKQLAKITLQ